MKIADDASTLVRMGVKAELVALIDQQARWRMLKAEEYPEDRRNYASAQGLFELAKWVEELSDKDERLRRLGELARAFDLEFLAIAGPETSTFISRYGFNYNRSHEAWLSEFIGVLEADLRRSFEDEGELLPAVLRPPPTPQDVVAARERLEQLVAEIEATAD